jgi:hypothetical protein
MARLSHPPPTGRCSEVHTRTVQQQYAAHVRQQQLRIQRQGPHNDKVHRDDDSSYFCEGFSRSYEDDYNRSWL